MTKESSQDIAGEGLYVRYVEEIRLRNRIRDYSAFYFNIEGIKQISEKYGYLESRKVSRKYTDHLNDFIENGEFLCSLGENNFCALIKKHRTDTFRRFISSLDIETVLKGKIISHHLSAVTGVWEINEEILDSRDVINYPALAFIEAKYILRQPYMTVQDGTVSRSNQKGEVVEAFRNALSKREFRVYYQPKVDVSTGAIVGAEALVRWYRGGEIVSPGMFIRPFEPTGDILQLDYYVMRTICSDIKQWQAEKLNPVPVSANFSRKNLLDEDLAENISYIISGSGVDKNMIEIEIPETDDSQEHSFMADFFVRLKSMGIRIAIDNFGSGYASLLTLRNLKVDTIKIDRSFINTDDFSQKDETILTHIIGMAKQLGISVIMQGVEREDQLRFVQGAGCNLVQGFYYDRPLPKEEFEERLKKRKY